MSSAKFPNSTGVGQFIRHITHMISYLGSYLASRMKSQPFYNAVLLNSCKSTELLYRLLGPQIFLKLEAVPK